MEGDTINSRREASHRGGDAEGPSERKKTEQNDRGVLMVLEDLQIRKSQTEGGEEKGQRPSHTVVYSCVGITHSKPEDRKTYIFVEDSRGADEWELSGWGNTSQPSVEAVAQRDLGR